MKIGVFDSGIGGLTVLKALRQQLPWADYVYLGDTVRLPYGSKSPAAIIACSLAIAQFLVEQEQVDYLVIACNTATAWALDAVKQSLTIPVLGVIEAGANAAKQISTSGDVLVMATDATVRSHAYQMACEARGLRAFEKSCPLLVPLIEEGWIDHVVTQQVLQIYLSELLDSAGQASLTADTLVLGCTHYPLLHTTIQHLVPSLSVIDSSAVLAAQMRALLEDQSKDVSQGQAYFYATDAVERFAQLGQRFLGENISSVRFIHLEY